LERETAGFIRKNEFVRHDTSPGSKSQITKKYMLGLIVAPRGQKHEPHRLTAVRVLERGEGDATGPWPEAGPGCSRSFQMEKRPQTADRKRRSGRRRCEDADDDQRSAHDRRRWRDRACCRRRCRRAGQLVAGPTIMRPTADSESLHC